MTLPETPESQSPTQCGSRENTSAQEPRYQLRANRVNVINAEPAVHATVVASTRLPSNLRIFD